MTIFAAVLRRVIGIGFVLFILMLQTACNVIPFSEKNHFETKFSELEHCVDLSTLPKSNILPPNTCYIVRAPLKLAIGSTLKINSGVQIFFAPDAELVVEQDAQLIAIGDVSSPIVFQRLTEQSEKISAQGDNYEYVDNWGGITISSKKPNKLAYTNILHAGRTKQDAAIKLIGSQANPAQLSVENSTIAYSKGYAIVKNEFGRILQFRKNKIKNNYAIMKVNTQSDLVHLNDGNTFKHNAFQSVDVEFDIVDEPLNIQVNDLQYNFASLLVLAPMMISEGIEILFKEGSDFVVKDQGSIQLLGSKEHPISMSCETFRANCWSGIIIENSRGKNRISHTSVSYGSAGNLIVSGSYDTESVNLEINNSKFSSAEYYGILIGLSEDNDNIQIERFNDIELQDNFIAARLPSNALTALSNVPTMSNNEVNLLYIDGRLTKAQKWPKITQEFIFNKITLFSDLTIPEGSLLKFDHNGGIYLSDTGSLHAEGTLNSPIIFTSAEPGQNDWNGIQTTSSSANSLYLNYAIIDFTRSSSHDINSDTILVAH